MLTEGLLELRRHDVGVTESAVDINFLSYARTKPCMFFTDGHTSFHSLLLFTPLPLSTALTSRLINKQERKQC